MAFSIGFAASPYGGGAHPEARAPCQAPSGEPTQYLSVTLSQFWTVPGSVGALSGLILCIH